MWLKSPVCIGPGQKPGSVLTSRLNFCNKTLLIFFIFAIGEPSCLIQYKRVQKVLLVLILNIHFTFTKCVLLCADPK